MLLSSSRDKTVVLWTLTREEGNYGYAQKAPVVTPTSSRTS